VRAEQRADPRRAEIAQMSDVDVERRRLERQAGAERGFVEAGTRDEPVGRTDR
jgi:hypothetical protein